MEILALERTITRHPISPVHKDPSRHLRPGWRTVDLQHRDPELTATGQQPVCRLLSLRPRVVPLCATVAWMQFFSLFAKMVPIRAVSFTSVTQGIVSFFCGQINPLSREHQVEAEDPLIRRHNLPGPRWALETYLSNGRTTEDLAAMRVTLCVIAMSLLLPGRS